MRLARSGVPVSRPAQPADAGGRGRSTRRTTPKPSSPASPPSTRCCWGSARSCWPPRPAGRFADDEVRVILRPTRTYGCCCTRASIPTCCATPWTATGSSTGSGSAVERRPDLARAIPAERADLLHGDIPLFTTRPDSRATSGRARPADRRVLRRARHGRWCAAASDELGRRRPGPAALVHPRLAGDAWRPDEAVGRRRPAIAAWPRPRRAADPDGCWPPPAPSATAWRRWRCAATRRSVLDRAGTRRRRAAGRCRRWGWTSTTGCRASRCSWPISATVTGEGRYTALARAALAALRRQARAPGPRPALDRRLRRLGRDLYTLTHLGALWGEPALLAEAEAIVGRCPT